MERNLFSSIQLPGSKPGDANWECARWGFHNFHDLFDAMCDSDEFGDDKYNDLLLESMIELENDEKCVLNGTKSNLITKKILN